MREAARDLTDGRSLADNVLWNIFGIGIPLLVAIVTIPILVDGLGTARFGILTLAWMVVGYFSLFDLGLGRALTKLVAESLGQGRVIEVPSLIWTALCLMLILGLFGAVASAVLTPWLVAEVLQIPFELQDETSAAFYLLAASIPVVIVTTGLRGILEAYQRFKMVNAVRIPLGALSFLGPLAALPFSNSLFPVVATLVIARLISCFLYAAMCLRVAPELRTSVNVRYELIQPLLTFGGWMTVSNIIGPVIMYLDRLLIGIGVSMTAVAYYATPFEIVTKLWLMPAAFIGVIFPALSFRLAQDKEDAYQLFFSTTKIIFLVMLPVTFICVIFAQDLLSAWLGTEFSENSGLIMQVLTIGILVNSVAQVPSALIQAAGRPDLKAKIHLIELPLFTTLLYVLLSRFGIVGAAIAFTVRIAFDFAAFLIVAMMLDRRSVTTLKWAFASVLLGCILLLMAIVLNLEFLQKIYISGVFLLGFAWAANSHLLDHRERSFISRYLRMKA